MEHRDPINDHMEVMASTMLMTMALPDRHIDVDRPGDRSLFEAKASAHEG